MNTYKNIEDYPTDDTQNNVKTLLEKINIAFPDWECTADHLECCKCINVICISLYNSKEYTKISVSVVVEYPVSITIQYIQSHIDLFKEQYDRHEAAEEFDELYYDSILEVL